MTKYTNGLFIFRRDLRIADNTSLNILSECCDNIYALFIFTPEQITKNQYKSNHSIAFMLDSLHDLSIEIFTRGGYLYTTYGDYNRVISECIDIFDIDVVAFNIDITPYAKERDNNIKILCKQKKVDVISEEDYYLHKMNTIMTAKGEAFQKYTPFYNIANKIKVREPYTTKKIVFHRKKIICKHITTLRHMASLLPKMTIIQSGGRKACLSHLKSILSKKIIRDSVISPSTMLSAYIKFGCMSIREIWYSFIRNKDIRRQLIWRDFYANIVWYYPYVLKYSMKEQYNHLKWNNNETWFMKWCTGTTGYPIVDAAMRELNITGYMHNRTRLIAATFLVKVLLINWKKGEHYFATHLTDYDITLNNLNWQWCASTAVDSQPYFRIFNPWLQAARYDPHCEYIKKWVPELRHVPVDAILNWDEDYTKYNNIYVHPICKYEIQKEKCLEMYHAITSY